MLPDNLSPQEQIELQRMLAKEGMEVSLEELQADLQNMAEKGQGWVPGKGYPEPREGGDLKEVIELESPPNAREYMQTVSLVDGRGCWQTHHFSLSEVRLKAVRKLCSQQIAEDLQAEIKRINGQQMP